MKHFRSLSLSLLAFASSTVATYAQDSDTQTQVSAGASIFSSLITLIIAVIVIAGIWKVFVKAGEPGWAAIIPIYNAIVLLKVAGKPLWWIILLIIPFVNIVVGILVAIAVARAFGKGGGFAVGLIFLPFIFYPILGFGSATYVGPKTA